MKTKQLVYVLVALCLFSCSAPKEEVNPASVDNLKVTAPAGMADLSGTDKTSKNLPGYAYFNSEKQLVVSMTDGNGSYFTLSLDTLNGIVGSYTIDKTHNASNTQEIGIASYPYDINLNKTSTIKITGYDRTNNTITGVFALNYNSWNGSEVVFTGSLNAVEVDLPVAKRFKITVNDNNLATTSMTHHYSNAGTSGPLVTTYNNNGTIVLYVSEALQAGASYDLSSSSSKGKLYYTTYNDGTFITKSGSLTITSYNSVTHRIIGTLNFTATGFGKTITATNGTFNIILDK